MGRVKGNIFIVDGSDPLPWVAGPGNSFPFQPTAGTFEASLTKHLELS
jgi:hypothetical protein